jgi:hypothetical protein
MIVVEAPSRYHNRPGYPTLFIAGGITGAEDWHAKLLEELKDESLVVFNPKRKNFDTSDEEVEVQQITWEFLHIAKANAISFWFPPQTLCPITLFELGSVLGEKTSKTVFVGCDPLYARIRDVKIQVGLRNKKIEVVESLSLLASQIKNWSKANQND